MDLKNVPIMNMIGVKAFSMNLDLVAHAVNWRYSFKLVNIMIILRNWIQRNGKIKKYLAEKIEVSGAWLKGIHNN